MNAPATTRLPIAILISGRGSNMRAIAELAASGALPVEVRVVISDQPNAGGLEIARNMGIPTEVLSPRDFPDRPSFDRALARVVARYEPKLVVLAGFMRILTSEFIAPFAGRIMNIHPSLLPKYRGLHTHRRVLEAGDPVHGVTVHFVTEELDGGPLIIQACVDVRPDDTEESLSARIQREEHKIYPQAIEWFATGRLELVGDRVMLDGKALEGPVLVDARGT
ncbi:MAG TPA: phosphoribosylglycinamide formyltransferase [Steroidobacteraceae bacterium]